MATRIVLHIQDPETSSSMALDVKESFDQVLNKVIPLQGISSALEARETATYELVDGGRALVKPQDIEVVMELDDGSE